MESVNKVKVLLNANGELISVSPKSPEFGWIMLSQRVEVDNRGFFSYRDRFAFRAGSVADLQKWVKDHNVRGWSKDAEGNEIPGTSIGGKIVVKESLDQQELYPNKADGSAVPANMGIKYISAYARKLDIPCMVDDQPVYRKAYWTSDINETDSRVQHTNTEELSALRAEERAAAEAAELKTNGQKGAAKRVGVK